MNKNKLTGTLKRLTAVGLAALMFFGTPAADSVFSGYVGTEVVSATIQQKRDEKNQTQNKLDNVENKIDNLENNAAYVQSQIDTKKSELNTLMNNIAAQQQKIVDKQDEIDQANADLAAAEADATAEYDAMKLRIQYMYENSTADNIWFAIFEADGITDMLNRLEYISAMYESDRKLLTSYQDAVANVEDLKTRLTGDMEDLAALQDEYMSQQDTLEKKLADLAEQEGYYSEQLSQARALAQQYKDTIASLARTIQAAEEAAARAAAAEAARKREEERRRRQQAAANAASSSSSSSSSSSGSSYGGGGGGNAGDVHKDASEGNYNPSGVTGVSGSAVVAYALQFVGGPYKWGGNSLTNGCDCSGFVHLVYAHFGISTPRYSQAFLNYGQRVSASNAQAGDVVVYPGHVAIYIGNGCIVEAQSSRAGITSGRSLYCHSINGIRRYV